jgi:peptide-methionine (S)-S-oxide reductase
MSTTNPVTKHDALIGRDTPIAIMEPHYINGSDLNGALIENQAQVLFGLGCFWGAERLFWQINGVVSTSVGYSGGFTKNPTYEEVCSGQTGHAEVVKVVFDTQTVNFETLLKAFWEKHDPTQGMRQGNDIGTQYRSVIYVYDDTQMHLAQQSKVAYQSALGAESNITTEISTAGPYYFAEIYHQQYLAKNPNGYCGLGGTGVCFPPN